MLVHGFVRTASFGSAPPGRVRCTAGHSAPFLRPAGTKKDLPGLRRELLTLAADSYIANNIHAILFKRRLPVDPRHNSKIERPQLAKWAARQPLT